MKYIRVDSSADILLLLKPDTIQTQVKMPSLRSIASVAATLAVGAHALPQTSLDRNPGPYLNILARQAGKLWFGTAADIPGVEQNDARYMALLNDTNIFGEVC